MVKRLCTLLALGLLASSGFAKDKTKHLLPAYVLQARTVAVIIDPNAGFSIDEPQANETARKDVEAALLSWGRLEPVLNAQNADLVIVVRKGNGRLVNDTVLDDRQNNRPGSITSTDNAISLGGQRGRPIDQAGDASVAGAGAGPGPGSPRPQTEIGGADDSVAVYQGGRDGLSSTPAWRDPGKDGLLHPSVPAVAAFKKAIDDSEKAAAKKP